jgi:hypothetical protein
MKNKILFRFVKDNIENGIKDNPDLRFKRVGNYMQEMHINDLEYREISKYRKYEMFESLKRLKLPDNYYIACVMYEDNFRQRYSWSDFQVCITGTVKSKEGFFEAFERELGEELGLEVYNVRNINNVFSSDKWNIFASDLRNFTLNKRIKEDKNKDVRKKIGGIIFGDEKTMKSYLNSDMIKLDISGDGICGVVALEYKYAKMFLDPHFNKEEFDRKIR